MAKLLFILTTSLLLLLFVVAKAEEDLELLVVTVATEETDGFRRFRRSAKINDLKLEVLGEDSAWLGGDMNFAGGAFKINLLRDFLAKKSKSLSPEKFDKLVLLVTDAYDVLIDEEAKNILEKFKNTNKDVLFGAEQFCWPNKDLASKYPDVDSGYRYLNSGGFLGYASIIRRLVDLKSVKNEDDDQLYYTEAYLDEKIRKELNVGLDHKSQIFQNLNGASNDVELQFEESRPLLVNTLYETRPIVIHGNGPSKKLLNSLGNYLGKSFDLDQGCIECWEDTLDLQQSQERPQVTLALIIEEGTPFLDEFFDKIINLDYDKDKIDLIIHNNVPVHDEIVKIFLEKAQNLYHSVHNSDYTSQPSIHKARDWIFRKCKDVKCDYVFSVDSVAHLDNSNVLKLLIEQNRPFVAPMLVRSDSHWSNFWGAINVDGFYARSADYIDIASNKRKGLWNVPYVTAAFLIKGDLAKKADKWYQNHLQLDADMALCQSLRDLGVFMRVSNRLDFGHLVNAENFRADKKHPELWEIENNRVDWEKRYLHVNYSQSLEEDAELAQPCPDVYWFPIVTETYADHLVEEMENFGKWSDGSNQDTRLEGGYEAVPTRDIHMRQIEMEPQWLRFLDIYVRPLQEKVFIGYIHRDARLEGGYEAVPTRDIHMRQIGMEPEWLHFLYLYVKPLVEKVFVGYNSDPPRASMNFVVRYRPDEQPFLRPHHDSSTYTINIALNDANKDYVGGGCNFLRYKCAVPDTRKGWMLMHPGRLTHYHEGLTVTNGTRYIMVSFVDP